MLARERGDLLAGHRAGCGGDAHGSPRGGRGAGERDGCRWVGAAAPSKAVITAQRWTVSDARRRAEGAVLAPGGALASTFRPSRIDSAPLTGPQGHRGTRTTRKRPFARLVRVIVPATSPQSVPPAGPRRPHPFLRACPRASSPVVPPARRSGRKDHHCEPYPWAHERSSRSPSRAPSSSASPRRPRPRRRPSPPKASRSSRSRSGSSAIRGATARPGRTRSIAPDWWSTRTGAPARAPRSRRAASQRALALPVLQVARQDQPDEPEGR